MTEEELKQACSKQPFKRGNTDHTRSARRTVKLTTEAAAMVISAERQDKVSLSKLAFR